MQLSLLNTLPSDSVSLPIALLSGSPSRMQYEKSGVAFEYLDALHRVKGSYSFDSDASISLSCLTHSWENPNDFGIGCQNRKIRFH